MEIAFDNRADFSGMGPNLFISEVRHKTFVEVNEEGTEAAAATSVVGATSVPPTFRVDRPFFFAIYDAETQTIRSWELSQSRCRQTDFVNEL